MEICYETKVLRIFQLFDVNRDGVLSRDELAALAIAVNPQVNFSNEEINTIVDEVFYDYGEFIDGENGLTYEGMLWMYDDGAGDIDREFDTLGFDRKPNEGEDSDYSGDVVDKVTADPVENSINIVASNCKVGLTTYDFEVQVNGVDVDNCLRECNFQMGTGDSSIMGPKPFSYAVRIHKKICCLSDAYKVFDYMSEKNTFTWNSSNGPGSSLEFLWDPGRFKPPEVGASTVVRLRQVDEDNGDNSLGYCTDKPELHKVCKGRGSKIIDTDCSFQLNGIKDKASQVDVQMKAFHETELNFSKQSVVIFGYVASIFEHAEIFVRSLVYSRLVDNEFSPLLVSVCKTFGVTLPLRLVLGEMLPIDGLVKVANVPSIAAKLSFSMYLLFRVLRWGVSGEITWLIKGLRVGDKTSTKDVIGTLLGLTNNQITVEKDYAKLYGHEECVSWTAQHITVHNMIGIALVLGTEGCKRLTYSPIYVKTGLIVQANGSAKVKTMEVTTNVGRSRLLQSDKGKFSIYIDSGPTTMPEQLFSRQFLALQGCLLDGKIVAGVAIDPSSLMIVKGKIYWDLYIKSLVISSDENLLNASGVANKAVLSDIDLPRVDVAGVTFSNEQLEVDVSGQELPKHIVILGKWYVTVELALIWHELGAAVKYNISGGRQEKILMKPITSAAIDCKVHIMHRGDVGILIEMMRSPDAKGLSPLKIKDSRCLPCA